MKFVIGFLTAIILVWFICGISRVRIYYEKSEVQQQIQRPIREYKIGNNGLSKPSFYYIMVDGHQYLTYFDGATGGLTHSPKCDCVSNSVGGVAQ